MLNEIFGVYFTLFLELWGGAFYLLNKIFFCCLERTRSEHRKLVYHKLAWISYIVGVPPWVFVLALERNWIAAAVESGGIPSMIMGLLAYSKQKQKGRALDHFSKIATLAGVAISFYDIGGLFGFIQIVEILLAMGFLLGTYFSAKGSVVGYYWLAFANLCCAYLTWIQGYAFLAGQQLISILFILDAILIRVKRSRKIHHLAG